MRAAFSVAVVRFEAGRLVAPRGGFLRFASSAAGFGRLRFLHPNLMRPRGRGPGAWTAPARGRPLQRCGNPPAGGCAFASAPAPAGAARCPHGSGSNPSPRPSQGRERVALCRQRCQAINGQAPHTASVEWRATESRPSPCGRPVAGLDSDARQHQRKRSLNDLARMHQSSIHALGDSW